MACCESAPEARASNRARDRFMSSFGERSGREPTSLHPAVRTAESRTTVVTGGRVWEEVGGGGGNSVFDQGMSVVAVEDGVVRPVTILMCLDGVPPSHSFFLLLGDPRLGWGLGVVLGAAPLTARSQSNFHSSWRPDRSAWFRRGCFVSALWAGWAKVLG